MTKPKWVPARRDYEPTWFGVKGKPARAPDTKKLPTKAGELIVAKGPAGLAKSD